MLEQLTKKLMPYQVLVVPATCYQHEQEGTKDPVCEFFGFQKRFITQRGFEGFIAKLEDPNNHSYPGNVLSSARPDERTYIGIPDVIGWNPGEFSVEIPEQFKQHFPDLYKS